MTTQRARFEEWFKYWRGPRTPEEEAALLKVADAYDAAWANDSLSQEELRVVVDAASSKRALLWNNASGLLAILATRWDSAAEAINAMFKSSQLHVRFSALCCLTSKSPVNLIDRLLCDGLTDKSSRVRWKAAQTIGQFEKAELLPQLDAAVTRERNAKARESMEFELRLLRDGQIVEPSSDSQLLVTVRTKDGGIRGAYVTEEVLQEKGIAVFAVALRNR